MLAWVSAAWTELSALAASSESAELLAADRFRRHSGDTPKGNIALPARCGLLAWT